MKPVRSAFFICIVLLLILAACAPQSTPTAVEGPGNPASSASSSAGSGSPATPPLTPIVLSGPEMAVGSTFLYVDGSILVAVPGGIFTMGHGGFDNLIHQVNLSDFWIYRTKVTNGQYAFCVGTGKCTPPNRKDDPLFSDPLHANDPVVGVDHAQASAYCAAVHGRLPTEAEWEKTARGPDGNLYPWGDGKPQCGLLNFENCVGNTTPVNVYPYGKSYYEALDMEGNIFEWVADWYKADYYATSPADDPLGPDGGTERSVRSSAFNSGANQTEAASRFFSRPEDHRDNLGFRCVVEDPAFFAPNCQVAPVYGADANGDPVGGGQPVVSCPDVSIHQDPKCTEANTPYTIVDLNGPPGASLTVANPPCSPLGANSFNCTGSTTVSICAKCDVTLPGDPHCPDGYTYDAASKTCAGKGGPGSCFGDDVYDPLKQCCSAQPGSDDTFGLPSCPVGTYYDSAQHACLSVPVNDPNCKSQGVSLSGCSGGNSCPLTDASCNASCPYGGNKDPNKCECQCSAG
jgi:formylglycine-generating enzyme required for sulfatase activity